MTSLRVVVAGDYPEDPPNLIRGIQPTLFYTLERLVDYEDLDLHVVTCEKGYAIAEDGPLTVRRGRLSLHYLPASPLPHSLTMLTVERLRVRRKIQELAPDVIHAHGQAVAYTQAALDLQVPTVITVHGMNRLEAEIDPRGGDLKSRVRQAIWGYAENRALRRAADLILISPFVARQIAPYTEARLHEIENPVHDHFFEVEGPGAPGRILFAGSIQARKGVSELIQAMAQVAKAVPEASLHLAGDFPPAYGEYQQTVQALVQRLGLEERVHFLGCLSHAQLLAQHQEASVFVLPSWLESSPVALAEAMAAGRPAVTTEIGGTEHLVAHGENGFRVPPQDANALAQALIRLLQSPGLCRRFGAESRRLAQSRFSQTMSAEKHRTLYRQLAEG